MSIKTKKITDLTEKVITGVADLEKLVLVGSSEGVTCKVPASFIASIMSSALQNSVQTLALDSKSVSDELATIKTELSKVKSTSSASAEKIVLLESRVNDLDNKIKSINKSITSLTNDVSSHILEMKEKIAKFEAFFQTIAEEDKVTLAKIQDASRVVYPVA